MTQQTSNWIPRRRIRFAIGLALAFGVVAIAGSLWSAFALALLVPALGAGWAGYVMARITRQLAPDGGGWERRIHDLVVARLALPDDTRLSVLDIGCGDASLLAALLEHHPALTATGIDFWGTNWDYAQGICEARLAQLGRHATFRRMNAALLAFPDASFDVVVSVMCFHEVRAPQGAALSGPLLALSEALRVLRPGGTFVLIDRFADAGDYDPAGLEAALGAASEVRRKPLVATLGVPWPLNSKKALGPVEVIQGRKGPARTSFDHSPLGAQVAHGNLQH